MANEITDAFKVGFPDGPNGKPTQPDKELIRRIGVIIQQVIDSVAASAEAAAEGYAIGSTWPALAAINGTRAGQPGRVPTTDTGTHTDPVVGGTVPNSGEFVWSASPAGWRRTGAVIDAAAVSALQSLTEPLLDAGEGTFSIFDEDGWKLVETDPAFGVGVGGGWFSRLVGGLLRVRDFEGWESLFLDRAKGLGLGTAWLRPSTAALLRIMDDEGFIYFKIGYDGLTKFIDGGSTAGAASIPAVATRIWTGAPTPNGFRLACDVEGGSAQSVAQIDVSTDEYFTNIVLRSPVAIPFATDKGNGEYWRTLNLTLTGLAADTQYFARVVVDGLPSSAVKVTTLPAAGSASAFSIIFGSCNMLPGDPTTPMPTFNAIAAEAGVSLFLHLGDVDYSDISVDDILEYRSRNTRAWRDNVSVKAMLANMPAAYMGDDHDIGPNDNHYDTAVAGASMSALWRNWRKVYRETVPHYPFVHQQLGELDPDKIIPTQVWDIGKARFVMLDTRTQRRYVSGTPTVLGIGTNPPDSWNQLGWFTGTFLPQAATDAQAGNINRLFVITPSGWTGAEYDGWEEHWAAEQTAICDAMAGLPNLPPMTILTGDFHYCAADDGTNTDKSTGHVLGAKLTQLMSSPFHRETGLSGGGPFSWNGADGRRLTAKAYCRLDVRADGSWLATFKGAPFDPGTGAPTVLGTFDSNDL